MAARYSMFVLALLSGCTGSDDAGNETEPLTSVTDMNSPTATPTFDVAPTPSEQGVQPEPTLGATPTAPSNPGEPQPTNGAGGSPPAPTGSGLGEPSGTQEPAQPAPENTTPIQPPPDGNAGAGGGTTLPPEPEPEGEPQGGGTQRSECPEAPPAEEKAPAQDRSLVVSKDEYSQLIVAQEPFQGSRGTLPYHLYTPEQATSAPDTQFPLVVVLHGGYGREVDDGNILVDVAQYLLGAANGLLTEDNRQTYPTYILAPHCRVGEGCNFGSNEWASTGGANFQVLPEPSVAGGTALELIEHVIATHAVDPARVYLTGNSMGGGGTWEFAQRRPELFAAVLPVSGHTPNQEQLLTIAEAKLPVWAFGAQNDSTNPYTDTVAAIDALQAAGGCAWLTTYQNAGHDDALWSSPYLEPGLWPWLFTQTNPSSN